jgi:hypothetical protein
MNILSRSLHGAHVTNRHRFGTGTDGNLRCLTSIMGVNLRVLRIEESKYIGAQTMGALKRYCPNVITLDLFNTPSVCQYDLAEFIASSGAKTESLWLRDGVYAGNEVMNAIGNQCRALQDLRLTGLECDISTRALACALSNCASTLRVVTLTRLFGGLSVQAVLPPWGDDKLAVAFPVLTRLEILEVAWLSGQDVYLMCKALKQHAPVLEKFKVAPKLASSGRLKMTDDQVAEVRTDIYASFYAFVWGDVSSGTKMTYGFDTSVGSAAGSAGLGIGMAGPA